MSWNYDTSLKRAQAKWAATEGLEVLPVVRETDFDTIALKEPRLVVGGHTYVTVTNFKDFLDSDNDEVTVRLFHLWARELTRVVELDFDAVKIHFQGPRLHAVAYRPIADQREVIGKVLLVAACARSTTALFNGVHELDSKDAWATAAGVDFGETVATRNGVSGDRELLFLGDAANQPAKILDGGLRITARAAALLPDDFSEHLTEMPDSTLTFNPSLTLLEQLVEDHGGKWTAATSTARVEDEAERFDEDAMTVRDVKRTIDKSKLGPSNTKRARAVSLYADIDGFTSYVDGKQSEDELDDAVRAWHAIRSEMRDTLVADYSSLRIQYQGDRMQGLVYEPIDTDDAIALKAVRIAAALTSVLTDVMPTVVGDAALPLAIGLAMGQTLVSRLGEHGDPDNVCLSLATAEAARIQEALKGGQIGIDATVRDLLPGWLAALFVWDESVRAYVISDLTLSEFERLEASESGTAAKGLLAGVAVGAAAAGLGAALIRRRNNEPPLKPYCGDG